MKLPARLVWFPLGLLVSAFAAQHVSAQNGAPSATPQSPPAPAWQPPSLAGGTDVALGGSNEPAIAVSPLSPSIVSASNNAQFRVSTNGGQTWGAAVSYQVPAGYFKAGDTSLAYDSQGQLFFCCLGGRSSPSGYDIFVAQLNPNSGAYVAGPFAVTTNASSGILNDKPWLAVDRQPGSPFVDRQYVVWTEFAGTARTVLFARSTDHGATWSAPATLSTPSQGFPWPAHLAVAANGDVYVAFHSQTGFNGFGEAGGNPDGLSGAVFLRRSTDGGVTWSAPTFAFSPAEADITFNVQSSSGNIPGTRFWLQGSVQPWVLPDPANPANVYVVANDDPDNVHTFGEHAHVYIKRSTDFGQTFGTRIRVDQGPANTFQVLPVASIDDRTGCIAVAWYDNRGGSTNGNGNWLLDVYASVSTDGGLTFGPDVRMNSASFDPDLGAPTRYFGPPATYRIGEYIGAAMACGDLQVVWTGNTASGQQSVTDSEVDVCPTSSITQQPASQVVPFGTTASFSSVLSGPGPFTYFWFKDDVLLTNGGSISGADSLTLVIAPTSPGDSGVYQLVVADGCGTIASDAVTLVVEPGVRFCAGDGLDPVVTTDCPCANFGAPGRGCANSVEAQGAVLTASGLPDPDTAVLSASGMPLVSSCIYLQGDALVDATFGDGVRCAGGSLVRLRTRTNVGGASSFPDSGDTVSLSVRGGVVPGSGALRHYQTYYRNAAAVFCPPETFNVTSGFQIVW
ncbi:MAG: hypothetical protein IPJ77_14085 [Planctomycetes bacterium]|nr:hypothetical protein [Planctomycetota bacterium]